MMSFFQKISDGLVIKIFRETNIKTLEILTKVDRRFKQLALNIINEDLHKDLDKLKSDLDEIKKIIEHSQATLKDTDRKLGHIDEMTNQIEEDVMEIIKIHPGI